MTRPEVCSILHIPVPPPGSCQVLVGLGRRPLLLRAVALHPQDAAVDSRPPLPPPSFTVCRVRHGMTSTLAAVDTRMTAVGCATHGRCGGSGSNNWRWVAVTGIGRRAQL